VCVPVHLAEWTWLLDGTGLCNHHMIACRKRVSGTCDAYSIVGWKCQSKMEGNGSARSGIICNRGALKWFVVGMVPNPHAHMSSSIAPASRFSTET